MIFARIKPFIDGSLHPEYLFWQYNLVSGSSLMHCNELDCMFVDLCVCGQLHGQTTHQFCECVYTVAWPSLSLVAARCIVFFRCYR